MRHLALILASVFFMPYADAKPKKKASGASRMESTDFFNCAQTAVSGRNDAECASQPDSNICVGLKLAVEYSFKKTRCFSETRSVCLLPGHKQYNEQQWMAVASGHLVNFMRCIRGRYGNENESGLQAALADPGLVKFLNEIDDGSQQLGLKKGEILMQSLQGRRLSSIIQNAPIAAELESRELQLLKGGADEPDMVVDAESLSNSEPSKVAAAQSDRAARPYFNNDDSDDAENIPLPQAVAAPEATGARALTSAPAIAIAPTLRNDLIQRSYKENPYSLGLDRSLFERVSLTYRRHSPVLQNVELYLKMRPKHPHDVRDEIQRGEAIEL